MPETELEKRSRLLEIEQARQQEKQKFLDWRVTYIGSTVMKLIIAALFGLVMILWGLIESDFF